MSMGKPRNHHYVPQYFLRAWSVDGNDKKTNRYQRVAHTGKVEFRKDASIRYCASEEDLYVISDGTDSAEFETIVMTEQLDTPGAEVVEKLRISGLGSLNDNGELFTLAKYVTSLEARNPKTIQKMRLSGRDLDAIRDQNLAYASSVAVNEVVDYFRQLDTGKLAAGLFLPLGGEFANALLRCLPLELKLPQGWLVTSDYPVGRVGDYRQQFMLSLAVAPKHAVLWFPDPKTRLLVSELPEKAQAHLVNFLTIGDADVAFTTVGEPDAFVSAQLGWKKGLDQEAQKNRVVEIIQSVCRA